MAVGRGLPHARSRAQILPEELGPMDPVNADEIKAAEGRSEGTRPRKRVLLRDTHTYTQRPQRSASSCKNARVRIRERTLIGILCQD